MGANRKYHHDYPLQVDVAAIPLPARRHTKSVQAEVTREIYAAVKAQAKRERRSIREIIEWAFCNYLHNSAPDQAQKLGIRRQSAA